MQKEDQKRPTILQGKKDGCFYKNGKIYVPVILSREILNTMKRLSGHFGFVKTLNLLKRQFCWLEVWKLVAE